MAGMFGTHDLPPHDLQGLPPQATALIEQMRQHIAHQADELQRKDREIALREAKIEKISFELARLKRWKFGAKTEAMSAEQRRLFEETLAEDEAGLQAQLDALRAQATEGQGTPAKTPRRPRRPGSA